MQQIKLDAYMVPIGRYDGLISAFGRLPETTKGCFVEAKSEKQCLGIRPVWRNSIDRFGSVELIDHWQLSGIQGVGDGFIAMLLGHRQAKGTQ